MTRASVRSGVELVKRPGYEANPLARNAEPSVAELDLPRAQHLRSCDASSDDGPEEPDDTGAPPKEWLEFEQHNLTASKQCRDDRCRKRPPREVCDDQLPVKHRAHE